MSDTNSHDDFDFAGKTIWVAGHNGMVGSALVRQLEGMGCTLVSAPRAELDLSNQAQVHAWVAANKIDGIFLAAAKVGGIHANAVYPGAFLYENLVIATNIIHAAHLNKVSKLLYLGSSCIYPRLAPQPMSEDALLTGPLEPTNQWYAIAKIAGLKMCEAYQEQYGDNFITAMPTNLYGTGDNFDLENSHVIPALMRKIHDAKQSGSDTVSIWGSGKPMREFLHVDDLASALIFLMQSYNGKTLVNVGTGTDVTITQLATTIANVVGFTGTLEYDATKPDGTPRKLLNTSRLTSLGWTPNIQLEQGLKQTYQWFQDQIGMQDNSLRM